MSQSHYGGESKPKMKKDGKKVIIKSIGVLDFGFEPAIQYREEIIYHFEDEEDANRYYYKKL